MNQKEFEKKKFANEEEYLISQINQNDENEKSKEEIDQDLNDNDIDFKDDETMSLYKNGRWEKVEHHKFLKGCLLYGNNWKKVIYF